MTFKDGDTSDLLCPKCEDLNEVFMVMETCTRDGWNHRSEMHYTVETRVLACPRCGYTMEYDEGEEDA